MNIETMIKHLELPKGKVKIVLDTDTFNEIDDQFALAYALSSKESMDVEAIYAAPFFNERVQSPQEGMEKSYDEILNVLSLLDCPMHDKVFKGSNNYLVDSRTPQESEAAKDLIERALSMKDELLYVVAIGAPTNVASAILLEPAILEKICVIWLGGHVQTVPPSNEFNLRQDVYASQILFDSGVPLVQIPCRYVASHLITTVHELEFYLNGKSKIGTYLTEILKQYPRESFGFSKVIWDISAIAYLVNPDWVESTLIHSPILNNELTWSIDSNRHFIRVATCIDRDKVFGDLFRKLHDN